MPRVAVPPSSVAVTGIEVLIYGLHQPVVNPAAAQERAALLAFLSDQYVL
jgi:hypothetical protein